MWRRILDWLFAACLMLALILLVARLDEARRITQTGTPIVNDGDSLTIEGVRVRLWGIDAPEFNQTCTAQGKAYPCGRQARNALQAMVRGKQVDCRGSEKDQYGRLLAICKAGDMELNRAMVDAGWALAYGGYEAAQANARIAGKGVWAGEFDRPRDWRQNPDRTPEPANDFLANIGDIIRNWLSSLLQGT